MQLRTPRLFFLIVSLSILYSCSRTVQLPSTTAIGGVTGGKNRVLIVPIAIDDRQDRELSGSGPGIDLYPDDQEIPIWFTQRLKGELKAGGFRVFERSTHGNTTSVSAHIKVFFTEGITHIAAYSFETDISVLIFVKRSDGLEAKRNYYVKGTQYGESHSKGHYIRAQEKATDKLMTRIVQDLISLMDTYPEEEVSVK